MREILFRGKRLDNGEWIEGSLTLPNCILRNGEIFLEGKAYICPKLHSIKVDEYCRYERILYGFREVDPATVGQYTGLCDKNGKKIFEGDILAGESLNGDTYTCGFAKYGEFNCSCCEGVYGWYLTDGDIRMLEEPCSLFVIGNIHDNPELLEVGE